VAESRITGAEDAFVGAPYLRIARTRGGPTYYDPPAGWLCIPALNMSGYRLRYQSFSAVHSPPHRNRRSSSSGSRYARDTEVNPLGSANVTNAHAQCSGPLRWQSRFSSEASTTWEVCPLFPLPTFVVE